MTLAVDVLLAPPFDAARTRGTHAVVIDVLRATTTIATALAHGAAGVIPAMDAGEAADIGRRLGRERVLFGGERESKMIEGFDLDNSPASYTREAVEGKTIAFTTTNGTRAMRALGAALSVRTAALVNRAAVADALAGESGEIVLVCAGDNGKFALEDALGAGALVHALAARVPAIELRDGARGCAILYRACQDRLLDGVASADHARDLAEAGFAGDLGRCAALDVLRVVPTLRDGILVPA